MGVAYVTGLQGNDPKYYLAIATPKHYDVHSGPEPTRHFADFDLKDRNLGIVTEDGNPRIAQGEYSISIGGGQPDTGAPVVTGKFQIDGQIDLPE